MDRTQLILAPREKRLPVDGWKGMSALEQRTVQVAKRYVGTREAPYASNRGPTVARFQRFIGAWVYGQPWCASFVSWCAWAAYYELREEGLWTLARQPRMDPSASSSALFDDAVREERLLKAARPGSVLLVRNGGRAGHRRPYEHACLVADVRGRELVCIEGNWRQGVVWTENRHTGEVVRRGERVIPRYSFISLD